jgi:glycosyltransferase involved in cell wall biosynthesis
MPWNCQILQEKQLIVLVAFLLITAIQLFYFWYFFSRVAFLGKRSSVNGFPPVSVIVSARNEYHNLQKNLPFLLQQDYPQYEVVVVDDGSDDESGFLLQDMKSKYPALKVVSLRANVNFFKGKKFPLSIGIKSASYEHLLLTDADCRPAADQWIKAMAGNFSEKSKIILGYGAYEKQPGFLNKLIRYDSLIVALQYMGFALAGKPYMGVGRNLCYHRQLFYNAKGFTSHYKIMSGDDDLFINQVAAKENTVIQISHESHTVSEPEGSFRRWLQQKKRHLSTGIHYKINHKWLLGTFGISQLLFYPLFIWLLIAFPSAEILAVSAASFLLRTVCLLIIIKYASEKLNEAKLFLYSPLLDVAITFLNLIFSISALFARKNRWK